MRFQGHNGFVYWNAFMWQGERYMSGDEAALIFRICILAEREKVSSTNLLRALLFCRRVKMRQVNPERSSSDLNAETSNSAVDSIDMAQSLPL